MSQSLRYAREQAFSRHRNLPHQTFSASRWRPIFVYFCTLTPFPIQDYIHKNKDYYLKRDELWARAYAQYIALKSGDPEVMSELKSVLNNPKHAWKQLKKSDWIPIEEAITKALKRRTWR